MSMEVRAITANIQCQVSGGEGHLSGEVDSRAWGLNGGRTQYFPGDTARCLIYISKNVNIAGVATIGGPLLKWAWDSAQPAPPTETAVTNTPPVYATETQVGYNIVREGISFSSPVAQVGKPYTKVPTIIDDDFSGCGEPQFLVNTNIVRLKNWTSTLSPFKIPPHGYMFIEYTPSVILGKMEGLGIPDKIKVFSHPNTVIIYGIASPIMSL